jgi:hypothetical protein
VAAADLNDPLVNHGGTGKHPGRKRNRPLPLLAQIAS